MKSLLYKDIIAMKKEILLILIFLLTYSLLAALAGGTVVYSFMGGLCGVIGMLPAYTFTYDEKNRFDSFACATPLPKRTVVLSKYLLGMLGILPLLISMAILMPVAKLPLCVPVFLLVACATLIFSCVQIPLYFLLGANKARIITMVLFFLVFFAMFTYLNYNPFDLGRVEENSMVVLILLATVAVFTVSYLLSYRIYLRKEF